LDEVKKMIVYVFNETCAFLFDPEGSDFYRKEVAIYISQIFRNMPREPEKVLIIYLYGVEKDEEIRMLAKTLVSLSFLHAKGIIAEITDLHISALSDEDFYRDMYDRATEYINIIEIGEVLWLG